MAQRTQDLTIAAILVVLTAAIGTFRLGEVPAHPTIVETDIVNEARRVVSNAGPSGWPAYFETAAYPAGREPLAVYATAASIAAFGDHPVAARLPSALLGIVNVLLTYAIARRTHEPRIAVAAPTVLLTSPLHVVYSRVADTAIYPLPFVLLWLWCVSRFVSRPKPVYLAGAGAALGIGLFTHPSATVVMPVLFAVTMLFVLLRPMNSMAAGCWAAAGFGLPFLLWAVSALGGEDRLASLATHYRLYDGSSLNVAQGIRDMFSYFGLSVRSYVYWQYFSPSLLFYAGGPIEFAGSQHAGAVLLPVALLLGVGLFACVTRRNSSDTLAVVGLITAPLAAALEPSTIDLRRALVMLPFLALVSASGFGLFISAKRNARYAAVAIALFTLVQFGVFCSSYWRGTSPGYVERLAEYL